MTTTAQTTNSRDADQAYRNLETRVRELANMTAIARFYVCETHLPTTLTEDERQDAERTAFAIAHIAQMAEDLEKAYLGDWPGEEERT
jgi:hypothetical protein